MSSGPFRVLELRSVRGTGGGPEKTILLGAERADRDRCAVTVCYIRAASDTAFAMRARAERAGIDYLELTERGSFDPRIWPALRRVVRERAIDIVHAHDYKTDLLALMLAKTEGVIPVATAHGWTGHSPRERWLYYPADKQVLRAFPITIAVSGEIRDELIRAGARPERVRVILNGIDPFAFRRDRGRESGARHALDLAPTDVVIGSAGRLEPQKRFDVLIRACAELLPRWPTLRLVIAGQGSLYAPLETLGKQLLPGRAFRLLGHQPDIVPMHHALDVFVQSSDYEGTSNAVLEAMALATPVVATAAGGTAEILEDEADGLIVPPNDVGALAAAIERCLQQPVETAARRARARLRVETRLSFGVRMEALDRIYEEAMGRRPDPQRAA
jgi:glycosyltransferase involved in cell wall biosynthesis